MIILNITTKINWDIHEQWKSWLLTEHIPGLLATGLFEHYQLVRLIEVDDHDGPTYALQLYTNSCQQLDIYRDFHQHHNEKKERELWGDRMISFQSAMEVIN